MQNLARAPIVAIAGIVAIGTLNALRAQAPAPDTKPPAFEVAAIKPNNKLMVGNLRPLPRSDHVQGFGTSGSGSPARRFSTRPARNSVNGPMSSPTLAFSSASM